jgi:hypothetical protein
MDSKRIAIACLAAVTMTLPGASRAVEITGKEVMRRYQVQDGAKDEVFDLKMTLVDPSGTERRRTATTSKKRRAGDAELYSRKIVFHDPPEMARSGVLTLENPSGDNDQWVYLPAYHTTRRIASENRRNYYMGTDFTYEDIYTWRLDDYEYGPVREESVAGSKCYVFETKPSSPALKKDSGYSKTVYWIDSEHYLVLKAEFYDRDGKLLKIHSGSKPVKVANDKFRVSHQEVENVTSKHKTLVDYDNFKIDSGLQDDLFTLRSLERGR